MTVCLLDDLTRSVPCGDFFRRLPNGNIEVGVHIADVSYFVQQDSALDLEARSVSPAPGGSASCADVCLLTSVYCALWGVCRDRGTTVYLVDRRLDMLPAVLSSNLCSIRSRASSADEFPSLTHILL